MKHPAELYKQLALETVAKMLAGMTSQGLSPTIADAEKAGAAVRAAFGAVTGVSEETPEERIASALEQIRSTAPASSGAK